MAEITTPNKRSTRVDLTPMVDLGFLLITFFVFTTSLSKPTAMQLFMPVDSNNEPSLQAEGKVITLLPNGNNVVYYYAGQFNKQLYTTDMSSNGIRKLLLQHKQRVAKQYGNAHELTVLIKPTEDANYQQIVDMLDEMQINDITRYMLLEADNGELLAIR